jgi:hypothetical protein
MLNAIFFVMVHIPLLAIAEFAIGIIFNIHWIICGVLFSISALYRTPTLTVFVINARLSCFALSAYSIAAE